uniref:Uncharacterized protein n=1 Tax=Acrobeloides nanus TaxID=290746 RepID=A0A914DQJ7_9BILA
MPKTTTSKPQTTTPWRYKGRRTTTRPTKPTTKKDEIEEALGAINETFINTTTEGYTTEPPYTGAPTLGYNKRGIILKIN